MSGVVAAVEVVDILIVEDSAADAEMALRAIRSANLLNPTRIVSDGAEALEYLLGREGTPAPPRPKVVLLDLKLPKVSGLEVLETLRRNESTRHLPIVILTSSAETPDVRRAYELGANSYIVKPVEFDKFVEAIGRAGLYWLMVNRPPE
jgi:two-component system, response regulator